MNTFSKSARRWLAAAGLAVSALLAGCGDQAAFGGGGKPAAADCATGAFCAGAAKRIVTPTQEHIDGVTETRLGVPKVQKFNLGGFGINPLQNFPDPFGALGESLTQPAQQPVYQDRQGALEDTFVRVMVLSDGQGLRVAFIALDAVGAGNLIQQRVKAAINAASCALDACIEPNNILFGQTHTHAGADLQGLWGGVPQDWVETKLVAGAADAMTEALNALEPVHLRVTQALTNDFNNYRRPRVDPVADADPHMTLLEALADGDRPVGTILQYNAHPTSINEDPRIPHADYILGALEWLEDPARGGGVALYFNGPIADASGSGARAGCTPTEDEAHAPYEGVRCRGEGMADFVLANGNLARDLEPTLAVRHAEAILPVTNPAFLAAGLLGSFNRYYDFAELPAEQIPVLGPLVESEFPQVTPTARSIVSRVTIGGTQGLEIVTIPGEATNTFGNYIRSLADPAAQMMLLGLTHNSFGYIIPEEEFSYVNPDGDAGFVAPFTGYEEFVSMGPLTAPLLRLQAYNPLFDVAMTDPRTLPYLAACADPANPDCLITDIAQRVAYIQRAYAEQCLEAGAPEAFCALINPDTPLRPLCLSAGLPEAVCDVFGAQDADSGEPTADQLLELAALDALLRGCDVLDDAACLLPFPNDHFTVAAPAGSPQSLERGGTGRRVAFNPLSTPRNAFGRPIDATEWNRNDGFSPGALIVTYVPGLGTLKNADGLPYGPVTGAVPLSDLSQAHAPNASVLVLEVPDNAVELPQRHLVWAEIDLNAGALLPGQGVPGLLPARPALLIRPAVNFREGRRYVVVLRNLVDDASGAIPAGPAFALCRDQGTSALPPVTQRCAELEEKVFPVLAAAGVVRDESLYLAWDFTVASSENQVARLRHMRDDAFINVLGQQEDAEGRITALGSSPAFSVTQVIENPTEELARRIHGVFTVPSYVIPADPSPLDANADFLALLRALEDNFPAALDPVRDQCGDVSPVGEVCDVFSPADFLNLVASVSIPPNRLFYNPSDGFNPADPQGAPFGDGLPDRTGTLTTRFTCNIPLSALSGKDFASASTADVRAGRGSLYGHGLLGGQGEINQDQLRHFGNEHNVIFCATDWFGFASGDLVNVVTTLVDLSFFPVVPDGSLQGMLNQLFLARLLRHPEGFRANESFQVGGASVLGGDEVFYDGNSQGGILGGVVVAASKDIQRGSLGVIGMNYSTLLTRSVDFALYSIPLYLSYQDDLDRSIVFSLMQMLWDRSENNGYSHHLTDNRAFRGPDNQILPHPAFADHQVTMWSADVMARTIGARVDRSRIDPARHPDDVEYFALEPIDFGDPAHDAGSALVVWDEPWSSSRCEAQATPTPPIGNVPPTQGDDPHECPRRELAGRCQKARFLAPAGRVVDVLNVKQLGDCPG